ncbi:MAG: family 20 glycosylhydrolase [Anaerolineales bacterium]|nr:family 20 glycosylhydrolase [Anaerolineales bacterium]
MIHFLEIVPAPQSLVFTGGAYKVLPNAIQNEEINIDLVPLEFVLTENIPHDQGYEISILPQVIQVRAKNEVGLLYGRATLIQIARQFVDSLPTLEIKDWPDLERRGYLLDISRDKVPTMESLLTLIDLLAGLKYNELQLYMEHTFAYANHNIVWANASPLTGEEIRILDVYCKERFIDLVPNQNSFGHMERWLKHSEYAHLAETFEGSTTAWGTVHKGPFSLAPGNESLEFINSLYGELLPYFSSQFFNIGCDETFDLGQGKSKNLIEEKGKIEVYVEFVNNLVTMVRKFGKTSMIWADMILENPKKIDNLSNDALLLIWGYEADYNFADSCRTLANTNRKFLVCPGTSSWNSICGRVDNMKANIAEAVRQGIATLADGVLVTDWGDNGHWQTFPISLPGIFFGAGLSWAFNQNLEMSLEDVLNILYFEDRKMELGKILLELGNLYQKFDSILPNRTHLFELLAQDPIQYINQQKELDSGIVDSIHRVQESVDGLRHRLECAAPNSEEGKMALEEIRFTVQMVQEACYRGLNAMGETSKHDSAFSSEFMRIWLLRNRTGGMDDSLQKMHSLTE